jgi:quercetin dioxygenase-like cupin family protein
VPIEVRRFGVGHRRPEGPPGTVGIEGQVIESGDSGVIAELAFGRHARIAVHSNPNATYFVVIEGGGWVGVGEERTRVLAGEAAVWPPNVPHTAWTDGAPMRAIVVELPEPPRALPGGIEGEAHAIGASAAPVAGPGASGGAARRVAPGEGRLVSRHAHPPRGVSGADNEGPGEPL